MPQSQLYLGLDVGGTKTALCAALRPGEGSTQRTGPGANLQRHGLDATAATLADLIDRAVEAAAPAPLAAVCLGVAGAGRPDDRDRLTAALRQYLGPDVTIDVRPDSDIALEAAFRGGSGLIIIAGTGSIVLARTRHGDLLRAGGWGSLLGDEGGGYQLGLQALQAVADRFDGGPATVLAEAVADAFDLTTPSALIHAVYADDFAIQHVAPLVLDAAGSDEIAAGIVQRNIEALAQRVAWLVRRTDDVSPRIALFGGLTHVPAYRTRLIEALDTIVPDWPVQQPVLTPAEGALRLALQDAA